ncbi:MAG: AMP-binding protein, partial [Thiogranum sp.]
ANTALADGRVSLSYLELQQAIERTAALLPAKRIGLLLANGCQWAVLNLATQRRATVCVPMPPFFSDAQLRHLIADAGLEVIITDQRARALSLSRAPLLVTELTVAGTPLACCTVTQTGSRALPARTTKVSYTSGTTGQPRGVCLSAEAVERVTVSLGEAVGASRADKALTLLPLSTLLANIAGVYAPLYSGSTACVPDLADCGISGSTGVRTDQLVAALHRYQPTVTVLVPHLLKILVEAATQGASLPPSLRHIAVGGAPVSTLLLKRARSLGLPVYQGYGLSEAASVVSMNVAGQDCISSVGRPLPHARVRIAADGEIMVGGCLFSGYLGEPLDRRDEWATGDLGYLDNSGHLHITGRKKTAFATAHGRKLAPEWIESELAGAPAIIQAALFGEGRSFNVAVLVPGNGAAAARIEPVIEVLNKTLPDYARVRRWIIATEPFSVRNGLANGAGVLNREAIAARYSEQIQRCYEGEKTLAVL